MSNSVHSMIALALTVLAGNVASCTSTKGVAVAPTSSARPERTPIAPPPITEDRPRDYPGIHNAVTYHDGFVSGSVPDGDAGFETLAAMGVKTIISVDGARPEVAMAAARGIRYIHLPIGYNGFDERRKLQLVRATRDAMMTGRVYIHCHHGKHRSAGAAATIATSLGWETPEAGVERMKISGTAMNYKGLYACAAGATALDAGVIDGVSPDFSAAWPPSGLVQGMLEIDDANEHIKAIEKAGWTVPADHVDLVPAAEAGRLADRLRVLIDGEYAKRKPPDFAAMLRDSSSRAQALEDLLVAGEKDGARLSAQFKLVAASCTSCHAKYRD